ncbi:maltose alpha-D-glucosyltransferase [Azomonas macrocytogenes]|uniref:Maltokinase n=1 Tax=Azomonas macrocytogenes TaxID=69962 RepID=A0A839SZU5_AZOMA|nr:maltose alpha-D-glucosyltransferase [Azomonas macrocytogenes]MBB3101776.1 maltose alpha-D-glucosyltransferase/alpha-amylase [Azomonas macrocytogenes]
MAKSRKSAAFITDPLWYKDAVIYQVHLKSFFDSNNDGVGDFPGLIQKLDYIADLGVNTIWLLPFYPSPRRDDGYDIAEYRGVHQDYGSMADAKRFIAEAHKRGLRVITELVINHTSDQHPWFQRARLAKKGSAARNFYVWSDTDDKYQGTRIIFLDTEKSNWTWDPLAQQFFWHRFYSHQPDLNFDNPQVMKAVIGIMRYWLDLGIDGLRLDAIPYLVERDGTNNENLAETHMVLKRIRAEIDANYPDRMLLAEANQWPEDTQLYFGGIDGGPGDECHMAFHFPLMPRMYMAIAQEDRFPITDILRQTPDIPDNCQWAIFLRNHDELTLEMVTDRERDYLWNYYASDKRARINLGIRRRLTPLLERDRRRIELLNSLLLSMPGTPVIYYGDEIGMGDNIYLGDRDGVRTPMQWSSDRNGGFSRADPASLVLPSVMDPLYGYQAINVEAQQRDPYSLLNWMRRLLTIRKQFKAFGRGSMKIIAPTNRRILAYLREFDAGDGGPEIIFCVVNVSRSAQAAELDLSHYAGMVPVEIIGGSAFPPIGQLFYLLTLPPYGFYWFQLVSSDHMPSWHKHPVETMPEFRTLVIKRLDELDPTAKQILEKEILPTYLPKRRWFASKDSPIESLSICYTLPFGNRERPMVLSEIAVKSKGHTDFYQLPLGFLAEADFGTAVLAQQLAMARVRRGSRIGLVTDAFTLDSCVLYVLRALRERLVLPCNDGEVRFEPMPQLEELDIPANAEVSYPTGEQSNSSVIVHDDIMLKLLRRVTAGVHPELEMGAFLTRQGFKNISTMLGQVNRFDADGTPHALMVIQRFLHNQGDAWTWTLNNLDRAVRDEISGGQSEMANQHSTLEEIDIFNRLLGQRLGELHVALAAPTDDPAFASEITEKKDVIAWKTSIRDQVDRALEALEQKRDTLDPDDAALVDKLLNRPKTLLAAVDRLAQHCLGGLRIRVHGDLHLGQVLVVQGDACFIDFEGEPARPLEERRAKLSPLKDVSGILRSFDYAAAMTLRGTQTSDSSIEADEARRRIAVDYRKRAIAVFVEAYQKAAASLPHAWKDPTGAEAALTLFTLEKTAYEVVYEAENRPAWLPVPLVGLAALAQQLIDGDSHE